MDFALPEECVAFADAVERFAGAEILPVISDHEASGEFPHAIVEKMGAAGFFGAAFPENLGGAEAGASRTRAIFVQTFGHMLQNPVVALLCRGHPHLVDVEPESLQPAPLAEGDRDDLVLCRARLGNTLVAVPDLDTLEAELAQAGVASR